MRRQRQRRVLLLLKGSARVSRKDYLIDRFRDELGHVFRYGAGKIGNLVTTTRARRNDNFWMLIVDLGEKVGRHLDGEIVFLGQHSKRTRHSATSGVEHGGVSSR